MPKLLILALALTGCTTASPTFGPNGEPLVFIECDYTGMSACYQEAARRCPYGYRTVAAVDTFTPGVLSSDTQKNLTVACQ